MIAHEILYNRLRRDEILNNKISSLINIKKLRESKNEILFYGKDILDKIDELYEDKSNIYISKFTSYNLDDPPEFKDDPTLTARIKDNNISETVLIDLVNLSTYWLLKLGEEYKYFQMLKGNKIFFINYVYIINKISRDEEEETNNSIITIKDALIDYIQSKYGA